MSKPEEGSSSGAAALADSIPLSTLASLPLADADSPHVDAATDAKRQADPPTANAGTSSTPLYSCITCFATPDGRNLVVCIDGTANQFGLQNTHVVELYSRLEKNRTQLTYYNSGIGTFVEESNFFVRMKQRIAHGLDMAIALNLKKIVLSAYKWLCDNYQPGDYIYLFGFSRGAYQVRIIAGMIQIVGLLHKGNDDQIPFAYELYLANTSVRQRNRSANLPEASPLGGDGPIRSRKDPRYTVKLCEQFKKTLSHKKVAVHFVGAWDTVSSVGVTRGPSLPETTTGMVHVCRFRHALSLHERRLKFGPEYANGGRGPNSISGGNIKEVWFAGSHSDIGGGNTENLELTKFGPPLRWMLYEAMQFGLRVEPFQGGWGPVQHKPSMTPVWWLLEILPMRRLSYQGEKRDDVERWPHFCRGRRVQPGQLIHESAIEYMKSPVHDKTPARVRRPPSSRKWVSIEDTLDHLDQAGIQVEQDSYSSTTTEVLALLKMAVQENKPPSPDVADTIVGLVSTSAGRQSFIDSMSSVGLDAQPERTGPEITDVHILFEALRCTLESHHDIGTDVQNRIVRGLTHALAAFQSSPNPSQKYCQSAGQLMTWLSMASEEHQRQIVHVFGPQCGIQVLSGHTGSVLSVAYSPDGNLIASGSEDSTIRLWDAETGRPVGEPFRGHEDSVYSVAFSPDGRRLASGGKDGTVRIWRWETQPAVATILAGHESAVCSVAFSPDGRYVVSSSDDRTVRVWDVETGLAVGEPLRHSNLVFSVTFSPDGTQIASGSLDPEIRIWNATTHEVIKVLDGHTSGVWSVVFSPDGTRVISGSWDKTIRIWDVETGETVLGPLQGHTGLGPIYSVAISPNGRYIASGSGDDAVRLWDAATGQAVGEPLRGHSLWVQSVAFSPDSRRVVSGSVDKTLMIWEVE